MADKAYWFVFKHCGDAPRMKHDTQQEALDEAKRIAQINPGITIYVCKVLLEVKYDENPYRIKQLGKSREHEIK